MYVFIDTAVKGCHVALFDDRKIIGIASEDIERGHAEAVLPLYQNLIQSADKQSDDIESVYVTVGPGSFTGLRVGLTVARFIGFSLKVPVYGITTFQAFSTGLDHQYDRLVLIETKRSDYYCQLLDKQHKPLEEAQSLNADDIIELIRSQKHLVLTGDATERFIQETVHNNLQTIPQSAFHIEKIIQSLQNKELLLTTADAFYIRDADVTPPKK